MASNKTLGLTLPVGQGESLTAAKIKGMDPNLNPMIVTTANTENSGVQYINSGLGANFYVPKGNLKDVRIGIEYLFPLYQNVNGIQLSQKNSSVVGLQYSL